MKQNVLYGIIAALVVVVAILGYQYYQSTREPDGIRIELDKNGLSVKTQ